MTRFSTERSSAVSQLLLHLDIPNHHLLWKLNHSLEEKLILKRTGLEGMGEQESVLKLSRALEIMSPAARTKVLDLLRKSDQKAVETLEKLIFSFDDFVAIDVAHLQSILYEVDPLRTLALAMRNASEIFNERVMANVSDRVRLMLQEELEMLPESVAQDDIQKARNEIVYIARRLEKEGKVELKTQSQMGRDKEG
jgi:flagellar motor switch protein FliG